MALIHWQPWQEIEVLRRQFDHPCDNSCCSQPSNLGTCC